MKKEYKNIILLFVGLFIIKAFLTLFTSSPNAFSDSYAYAKVAWNIFHYHSLNMGGTNPTIYPPFYSIFLSIAYIFNDMKMVFALMKFLNAFIISIVIFPVYFIARDFLNKKDSLIISGLTALITSFLIFPNYILSENLMFALVSLFIFFSYKAIKKNRSFDFIMAGIVLGLSLLTRMISIALLPILFICYFLFKKQVSFKKIIGHYVIVLLVFIPYLIWGILNNPKSPLGYGSKTTTSRLFENLTQNILTYINWNINYIGYLILACGVFFAIYFLACAFIKKETKFKALYSITGLGTLFFILIAANHSSISIASNSPFLFYTYRPLGRYIASMFPFVMLTGFISYKKNLIPKKLLKISTFITSIILLISTQLTLSPLFPVNNSELTFLGIFKYLIEFVLYSKTNFEVIFHIGSFLIIGFCLFLIPFIFWKLRRNKIMLIILASFFIINAILAYSVHIWDINKYWDNNDQTRAGQWINNNLDSSKIILMDIRDCTLKNKLGINENLCFDEETHSSILGFWITNPINFGYPDKIENVDFIITMHTLKNHPFIKSFGKIKIYKASIIT